MPEHPVIAPDPMRAELLARFEAEYRDLAMGRRAIHVTMTALEAWALLSTVQLACRHPEFGGHIRALVVGTARGLQRLIAAEGALAEVAELGWDSAHDQGFREASEARCRGCGCTDSSACPGGCAWREVDHEAGTGLCTNCG